MAESKSFPRRVAVIGLGYVGLPLAAAFGKVMPTLGLDISARRVEELRDGNDRNGETPAEDLKSPTLAFSHDAADLAECDIFIVAVPTPIDKAKRPDLSYLLSASRLVGRAMKARREQEPDAHVPIAVFESTVYPGCTEEDCVPVIEEESGLRSGVDFTVGYSPERINPGDKEHTLEKIVKVVGAQDEATLDVLAELYGRVVKAGIHRAPDIKTAEAAKVIENTQRDLNIALMNELAVLCDRFGIETSDVLEAAGTKWNFLRFTPGLVGGHCIPEDPYYLTHKAQISGYHPHVILAGRRINDSMGAYLAHKLVKLLIHGGHKVHGARVLIFGLAFKEDVADVRNTRILDIVRELESYGVKVEIHDPMVDGDVFSSLGLTSAAVDSEGRLSENESRYDAVILAVRHAAFAAWNSEDFTRLLALERGAGVVVDVKGSLSSEGFARAGVVHWRL